MRYAILLTVLFAFPACGDSDEEAGGAGGEALTSVETQVATTTVETTQETTTEAEPSGPVKVRITYKEGKLRGATGTVRIPRGEKVQLIVHADLEDEVHLHGYDLVAEVAPDNPARINFEADERGTFIAELERLHLHIVTLRVTG